MKLLQNSNYYTGNYDVYLLESESELEQLENKPFGTFALIITEDGLILKIKETNGEWADV